MVDNETRLPVEKLRWTCDISRLGAGGTREVPPVEGTIGQDRGMRALQTGLELDAQGYNVFVAGHSGTGRTSSIKRLLGSIAPKRDVPSDRVYVYNFDDPDAPDLLTLPFGRGSEFAKEMAAFNRMLARRLPRLIDDKEFAKTRNEMITRFGERDRDMMRAFSEKAQGDGFAVGQVQVGAVQRPSVFAVIEEEAVSEKRIAEMVHEGDLDKAEGERLLGLYKRYRDELEEVLRHMRANSRKMVEEVHDLLRQWARDLFGGWISDMRMQFDGLSCIQEYLTRVERDLLEETVVLPGQDDPDEGPEEWRAYIEGSLLRYTVNVLTDHSRSKGAPVVVENHPSHINLFGTIERVQVEGGMMAADHRHIIAGSLLKAEGGYLVLNARDVLGEPGVWSALKRILKTGRLEIRPPQDSSPFHPTALKPEPIAIRTKVVMVGESGLYDVLYGGDPEFRKVFKIKAEFDSSMTVSDENLRHFASVIALICKQERHLPLSAGALAACAEHAVRLVGRRDRISTCFEDVGDVIREASFLGRQAGLEELSREYVDRAIRQITDRHSMLEDSMHELIEDDVIMVDTEGAKVGQVNGLSVYVMGYHSFGKPTRITAATSAGGVGIINVEREARLSGGIYDKGVLIISGWARRMFAQKRPLSLTASLCFEQSYSGVDGDSASVAEICALLSDLSGIPIDQGLAVTGSVNQHGEVQPIGGVNEKIEGFFRLCRSRGLTGLQGCVIPTRNVEDLMLSAELVEAVAACDFAVHAIDTVDQAIELLMGVKAGVRGEDGLFPVDSVYYAVEEKLSQYAAASRAVTGEMSTKLLALGRPAAGQGAADVEEDGEE